MQTLNVNMPQSLRVQLQAYQNDSDIKDPAVAIVAVLEAYFQTWTPTKESAPLPAMYDVEEGPCEVMRSFAENPASETC